MGLKELGELAQGARADFVQSTALAGAPVTMSQVEFEVPPKPHRPGPLPNDRMSVYCFFLHGQALKIGKAGPNSNARFQSQHYNPNSANSNLAKSIINHPSRVGLARLDPASVGDWIKSNTDRVNFFLPGTLDKRLLEQMEKFLHVRWAPVYEGRISS